MNQRIHKINSSGSEMKRTEPSFPVSSSLLFRRKPAKHESSNTTHSITGLISLPLCQIKHLYRCTNLYHYYTLNLFISKFFMYDIRKFYIMTFRDEKTACAEPLRSVRQSLKRQIIDTVPSHGLLFYTWHALFSVL